MKKYIYKITNIINNKCYIGQTKNYTKRFNGHRNRLNKNEHENPYLQYAWNKYGAENFIFEIIELTENYNEREKYWIKYFNSNVDGYNILPGGEEPPIHCGENNNASKLTNEDAMNIKMLLLSDIPIEEIENQYSFITRGQIFRINNGDAWFDEDLIYPLRTPDNFIGKEIANKIIDDLMNSPMKQIDIAKKYNVSRTFVTAINNGTNKMYFKEEITYPIRKYLCKGSASDDKNVVENIKNDLRNTTKSQKEIASKYNVSTTIVCEINKGSCKKYFDKNIDYPIRKFKISSKGNIFAS